MEQINQKSKFTPVKNLIPNLGKHAFTLIGVAIVLLLYFYSAVVSIPPGEVGVVFRKIGGDPAVKDRFIVEKGEKGIQREVLMPGWRFFWKADRLWKIDIEELPMFNIPKQTVGLVEALDGEPLPDGQILAKDDYTDEKGVFHMGQKGPRETVLTPGLHPINPKYVLVKQHPAVIIKKGQLGVVTKRVGDIPPPRTILVSKDDNYKGVQREVLVPGEYYLNPLAVEIDIIEAVVIPKGQVGIVTKRVGEMPLEGTILVEADDNFQGIQRQPLQPGIHYINPFEKDVKVIPAIVVPDGHVGVQIAKTGKPKPFDQLLAKPGQRGILESTLSPGLYYINPYEYEVVVFDTRQQRYEMTFQEGKGDTELSDSIKFLSDDGFEIEIDLTVLYQVFPENAPYVVATVGRDVKDVRDKIIRPSARSFARIIGSMNIGEEFVHGSTREAFQNNLHAALEKKCLASKVWVNQTLIRHFEVPQELRDPITRKVIAAKLEQQYTQQQKTQMANADLARQKELVTFQAKKVKAETTKMEAKIRAEQQRDVEETLVAKKKFEAQGDAEKIKIDADAKLYAAKKEAEGILVQKTAEAEGQRKMVNAWSGKGARFIVAKELANRLSNAKIIPLELFFGGSGSGKGGGVIEYRDNLELLKLLKIFDTNKDVKELRKGLAGGQPVLEDEGNLAEKLQLLEAEQTRLEAEQKRIIEEKQLLEQTRTEDERKLDEKRQLLTKELAKLEAQQKQMEKEKQLFEQSKLASFTPGIIYDSKTDLEWYVGPDKDTSWVEARSWVENCNVGGGGWRMPTLADLRKLHKKGVGVRNMDPNFKTTGWRVWSDVKKSSSSAWGFDFKWGMENDTRISYKDSCRVFAVRSRK